MSRKVIAASILSVATMLGVVAAAVAGPVHAQAGLAENRPSVGPEVFKVKYGEREMLQILLAGVGPVARAHPEIVKFLRFSDQRPAVNEEALNKVITEYLAYNTSFRSAILVPLQSGKPVQVERALRAFSDDFIEFILSKVPAGTVMDQNGDLVPASKLSSSTARAQGSIGFYTKAAMAVVVLANAVVYANVAVATNAAATLVLVWVYLMDDGSGVSEFERQEFVAMMTRNLNAHH